MATATSELTADQEFVKVWWESDTFREVVDHFKEQEGYDGKTEKQIVSKIKTRAAKIRKAGLEMQFFTDRITSSKTIDVDGLTAFLDDLDVSKKDRRDARDQADINREEAERRLSGKKKAK